MSPGELQGWAVPGAGHQLTRSDVFSEFLWFMDGVGNTRAKQKCGFQEVDRKSVV